MKAAKRSAHRERTRGYAWILLWYAVDPWLQTEVERLAGAYRFFHWHLAFPDVFSLPAPAQSASNTATGWNGGFSVVLGNPPWVRQETLKTDKKFFAMFESFRSTVDSSVLFLERSLTITALGGRVGMLRRGEFRLGLRPHRRNSRQSRAYRFRSDGGQHPSPVRDPASAQAKPEYYVEGFHRLPHGRPGRYRLLHGRSADLARSHHLLRLVLHSSGIAPGQPRRFDQTSHRRVDPVALV
jgi:hypothetical protein